MLIKFSWVTFTIPPLVLLNDPVVLAAGITCRRGGKCPLKGIMAAKKKTIQSLTLADLGLSPEELEPRQKILKVYAPPKSSHTEYLQDSPKEIATQLVDKLKNEARVI